VTGILFGAVRGYAAEFIPGENGYILIPVYAVDGSPEAASGERPPKVLYCRIEGLDGIGAVPEFLSVVCGESDTFRIPVNVEGRHRFRVQRILDVKRNILCTDCVYVVYTDTVRTETGGLSASVWLMQEGKEGKCEKIIFNLDDVVKPDGDEKSGKDEAKEPSVTPGAKEEKKREVTPTAMPSVEPSVMPSAVPSVTEAAKKDGGENAASISGGDAQAEGGGQKGGFQRLFRAVVTGDESNLVLYLTIFCASVFLLLVFWRLNRKNRD
jgi:hypothetical protein